MPRWEVNSNQINLHPIQIIIFTIGFIVFGWSSYLILYEQSTLNVIYFIFSSTLLIYIIGRIYGLLTIQQDFVELTKETLSFRSTPAFGQGWLPVSKTIPLEEIHHVDIIQLVPFQDPDNAVMALSMRLKNKDSLIFGNNLSEEQIVRIGLALKGTVTLSNALQKILGTEDVGEQIKDIVDVGKALWNSFKNRNQEEE